MMDKTSQQFAAERKAASQNWYNAHAVNLFSKEGYWRHDYNYILCVLKRRNPAEMIDIGCGTGAFLARAAAVLKHTQLYGMDISQSMADAAARRLGGRAQITRGDAEAMSFEGERFDAATCVLSIHHYPHAQSAVNEMYRILKPGGVLCINDMDCAAPIRHLSNRLFPYMKSGDVKMYCQEEIEQMLTQAGFAVKLYRKITPFTFLCEAQKPKATSEKL